MAMSKPIVSIQGYPGSYHDIAQHKYFKKQHSLLSRDTFKQVFDDLASRRADYAAVAIENSLFGSINEVYDLLLKHRFWISGEIYLRIHHCLVAIKGAKLDQISEVHSHRVALAQCEDYLNKTLWHAERFESHDTALSAEDVARWHSPHKAAVASTQAAKLHKLSILARNIETNKQNYTRFIVLQRQPKRDRLANKTSLAITMPTDRKAGALYRALGAFAQNGVNLSKLESRPLVGKAWHYIFYVDFDCGLEDSATKAAFEQLKQLGEYKIQVLGSYRTGQVIP